MGHVPRSPWWDMGDSAARWIRPEWVGHPKQGTSWETGAALSAGPTFRGSTCYEVMFSPRKASARASSEAALRDSPWKTESSMSRARNCAEASFPTTKKHDTSKGRHLVRATAVHIYKYVAPIWQLLRKKKKKAQKIRWNTLHICRIYTCRYRASRAKNDQLQRIISAAVVAFSILSVALLVAFSI